MLILHDVCEALAHAHEHGIVHRDIKPENVLLAGRHAMVTDFGVARAVSEATTEPALGDGGMIFGTPMYMAPEQAANDPQIDHRADIYSVGVIMYELFTGKVPFEAESFMGILTKHITTQPMPPRQAAPERDIPVEVEAVILRALAKEAEDRYQSMAELAGELASIAEVLAPEVLQPRPASQAVAQISKPRSAVMPARPVTPRPTPMPRAQSAAVTAAAEVEEAAKPKKKSAAPWIAMAAVLVAAAAGAVVWVTRTPEPTRPTTVPTTSVTPPIKVTTPVVTPIATPLKLEMEEVIVDSVPPGAKIFVDGVAVADAPEAIKVEKGKTKLVVLKKDGFVDQEQTVDPGKSHKLLIKLERAHHATVIKGGGKKLPTPPPASLDPPPKAPPPPVVAQPPKQTPVTQPPKKRKVVDPYERVDESPKKANDVLNPY
jgi:hypothetical protein